MPAKKKRFLITSALPYANGPIHLGHLTEYVQTDIYVRYLRSAGHEVTFVCADDTHGTPIELAAAKQGVTAEEFIAEVWSEHLRALADCRVIRSDLPTTKSPETPLFSPLLF